jgi:hypothetical protein
MAGCDRISGDKVTPTPTLISTELARPIGVSDLAAFTPEIHVSINGA